MQLWNIKRSSFFFALHVFVFPKSCTNLLVSTIISLWNVSLLLCFFFFLFFWSFQIFETDWIRKPESIYHFTTKPSAPVEKSNTSLVCHECRFWQKFKKKIIIKKRKYNLRMKRKNLFKIRQQQAVEGCSCGLKSTGIWVTHTHTRAFVCRETCMPSQHVFLFLLQDTHKILKDWNLQQIFTKNEFIPLVTQTHHR